MSPCRLLGCRYMRLGGVLKTATTFGFGSALRYWDSIHQRPWALWGPSATYDVCFLSGTRQHTVGEDLLSVMLWAVDVAVLDYLPDSVAGSLSRCERLSGQAPLQIPTNRPH